MNILGIDYGTKRIGLAWMQTGLDVILPYGVVEASGLLEFIKKENINFLVVGLPLGLDGEENENTRRVRGFAEKLQKETGLAIEFVDERFTTREAVAMRGDAPAGEAGATADEKAAMIILATYKENHI